MVRRPCCDKIGLNKGAWSPEEDQILVSYIQRNGHGNWRALPKQAGLLRCGKSCRLRWTNYLRPDIKRGNFSKQEEETIINLHQMLGNRWSAIAARLPGRTDNEIKNVWHTHLKKQLKNYESSQDSKKQSIISISKRDIEKIDVTIPSQCSSEKNTHSSMVLKDEEIDYSSKYFLCVDENFLSEKLSINDDKCLISVSEEEEVEKIQCMDMGSRFDDSMDVWYHLFVTEEDIRMPHLPEF